jgi:hypothetical protein
VPDELNDPGVPTDARYAGGFHPEEDDDNDDDLKRAMAESRQVAYEGSAGYSEYPPGYNQAEPSYIQEGIAPVLNLFVLLANKPSSRLRAYTRGRR